MTMTHFHDLNRSHSHHFGLSLLRYPSLALMRVREGWRRRQSEKMLEGLDPDIRKDIGWPASDITSQAK